MPNGCWQWNKVSRPDGYAQTRVNGVLKYVHVIAWIKIKGPIPAGMELDHTCKNRACINIKHLEPVTHKVNMSRASFFNSRKTHCPVGHELISGNLVPTELKRGKRYCLICCKQYQKAYRGNQLVTV